MKSIRKILMFISIVFLLAPSAHALREFGPENPAKLEEFLDAWFEKNMPKHATPGVSIAFVKNGETYISKGYGIANIHSGENIRANSIFRVASVSKIFVGIAAAQLIEQGKLDLDANVTKYIDSSLLNSEEFAPPTIRHLLAHTSGLDEQFFGDSTLEPAKHQSLEDHLKKYLPPQIRAPGELYAYSNYGYALIAYAIEKITGEPFSQYVQNHILTPLDMQNSGYVLNKNIKENLVTGYDGEKSELLARPYTYVHRYPPTSMMSSASDMANLMGTLLRGGTYGNRRIYGDTAANLLQTPLYETTSKTSGYSAGFQLSDRWGHQIIWHDGTHFGFNAYIMLFPELDMGFFAASNHHDGNLISDLRFDLLNQFFKPVLIEKPQKPYQSFTDHKALEGKYINSRRAQKNLAKVNGLFSSPLKITANNDNTINVSGRTYAEIKPGIFARTDIASRRLKANRDKNGTVTSIAYDVNDSPATFERQAPFETASFHRIVFLGFIVLFVISFPFRAYFTRQKQQQLPHIITAPNGVNLVFIIWFIAFFAALDLLNLRTGNIPSVWILTSLPLLSAVVSTFSLWKFTKATRASNLTIHQKFFWAGNITIQALFLLELHAWNLLGYHIIS